MSTFVMLIHLSHRGVKAPAGPEALGQAVSERVEAASSMVHPPMTTPAIVRSRRVATLTPVDVPRGDQGSGT